MSRPRSAKVAFAPACAKTNGSRQKSTGGSATTSLTARRPRAKVQAASAGFMRQPAVCRETLADDRDQDADSDAPEKAGFTADTRPVMSGNGVPCCAKRAAACPGKDAA